MLKIDELSIFNNLKSHIQGHANSKAEFSVLEGLNASSIE